MRTESVCCPKQYDGYDCGVGLTFAIMRFVRAFNIVNVSEKWINSIGVVIPSSIFSSLKYSIIHKNHLEALCIESFHLLNSLSLILHNKYKEPGIDTIYKIQFASISLPSYQKLYEIFLNHDEVNYLTPEYENSSVGIGEQILCKGAFKMLDQYNHCFIDVKSDTNSLFYTFALILREKMEKTFQQVLTVRDNMLLKPCKVKWECDGITTRKMLKIRN